MFGPTPLSESLREGDPGYCAQLFRRGRYRVIAEFNDHHGTLHPIGEEWLLLVPGFNRDANEFVLYVSLDAKQQWVIPLKESSVIDNFSRYAEWLGPLPETIIAWLSTKPDPPPKIFIPHAG